jgi:hypothetical protein
VTSASPGHSISNQITFQFSPYEDAPIQNYHGISARMRVAVRFRMGPEIRRWVPTSVTNPFRSSSPAGSRTAASRFETSSCRAFDRIS